MELMILAIALVAFVTAATFPLCAGTTAVSARRSR
jgi:hypothetical protein